MLKRIKKALDIMKACWKVFLLDKELLAFPLLTLSVLGLLVGVIIWPIWIMGDLPDFLFVLQDDGEEALSEYWMAAFGFVAYLVTFFVMIFFNSALIACVKIRFAGGDPTVMDGLRSSVKRLPQIFTWALISASVGFILSLLRDKKGGPLFFVAALIGTGWAVAVYFVVPILVSEKIGPITAVKRSVAIIKKTWGEALVAEVGFGLLYTITSFATLAFLMAAAMLFEPYPVISLSIIAISMTYVVLSILVFLTLGSILKAALYTYAVEGKLPDAFDEDLIKGAFKSPIT